MRASRVGAWVEITMEGTGTGITRDVAGAMFRPFFTTRPPGEGTGLGLAVAYSYGPGAQRLDRGHQLGPPTRRGRVGDASSEK